MEEDKVIKLLDIRDNLKKISCIMTVIASGDYSCDVITDIMVIADMCATMADDSITDIKSIIK